MKIRTILPVLLTGLLSLNVANAANTRPVADSQLVNAQANESINLVLQGSDADNDELSYKIIRKPRKGKLLNTVDNKYTYTPNADLSGSDRFLFRVNDGILSSRLATVKIEIAASANPPVLGKQIVSVTRNTDQIITLPEPATKDKTYTYKVLRKPRKGTLSVLTGNELTYTPKVDFTGNDSFTYRTEDQNGVRSKLTTVYLKVLLANSPALVQPSNNKKLNDTGLTHCGNYSTENTSNNALNCDLSKDANNLPIPAEQDAHNGRDADPETNNANDGHAGFSFSKIGADGLELPIQNQTWTAKGKEAEGTQWSCVKDNVTGLVWEIKTDDKGIHDKADQYTWYDADGTRNGGSTGYTKASNEDSNAENNTCFSYLDGKKSTYCNTDAYVKRINKMSLCGADNWRLPTLKELRSLVNLDTNNPAIDSGFFPNTQTDNYWSSTPYAGSDKQAWSMGFEYGYDHHNAKFATKPIRLVRSNEIIPKCPNNKDRDPVCGVENYISGIDPECGIENYNKNRGSECGVELYKNMTNPACGVLRYRNKRGSVCGVQRYKACVKVCTTWNIFGWCLGSYRYDRHASCGVEIYKSCRHSSFGVESYKSCRASSNPVERYKECRHQNFGVESYNACELPKFGINKFKECRLPKFGKATCN